MTLASTDSKVIYAGNGSTAAFAVPFMFVKDDDIEVVLTDAQGAENVKTISTDYTLTGAGDQNGGVCTMNVAPAVGESLTIRRDPAITQEVDYVENDAFPAATHEAALDKLTMICQALAERLDRTLSFRVSSATTGVYLPGPAAGRALNWNEDGSNLENGPTADEIANAQTHSETAASSATAAESARSEVEAIRDAMPDFSTVLVDGDIGTTVLAPDGDGSQLTNIGSSADPIARNLGMVAIAKSSSVDGQIGELEQYSFETDNLSTKTNLTYSSGSYGNAPSEEQSVAPNATEAWNAATFVSRVHKIPNDSDVISLGMNNAYTRSVTLGVWRRDGVNNYTRVATVAASHGGGGLEWFDLSSPYSIPATGDYYVGYNSSDTGTYSARSNLGAFANGDVTSGLADTTLLSPCLGFRTQSSPQVGVAIPAARTIESASNGLVTVELIEGVDTLAASDVTFEASVDGGANYTTATLAAAGKIGNNKVFYADVSGLTEGTSLVWRLTTSGTKQVEIAEVQVLPY